MMRLNEDGLEAVQQELVKATPEITRKILEDLDKLVAENTRYVKMEILNEVKEELDKSIQSSLEPVNHKLEKDLPTVKSLAISGLALAGMALLAIVWLAFK